MKPSEYFKNEIPLRVKIYMDEFNKSKLVLEELDKRFIDREELKEQIEHILQYEIDASFPSSNDFKNCIEKILKLLKE